MDDQLHLTTDGGSLSAKRKATEDEEVTLTKRVCLPSSSSSSVEATVSVVQNIAEFETELQSRRQQEEEDRRLALLLQKELDQEERQRVTDRRKGSSDAYLLRQNLRERVQAGSSVTPRKTSTSSSAPKTSTPSSAPSSSRSSKQATLTEMFSSPS